MEVPFPELAILRLSIEDSYVPVISDSFLGGSAPRLRYLHFDAVPFSGLTKLLLFATHLVSIWLFNIPYYGYISPEAMATCLSVLTSLEKLYFEFESPQSFPVRESQHPFLPTRTVLPALTTFWFRGTDEYLEDFVARIDAPRLCQLDVTFFDDVDIDTAELIRFASRSSTYQHSSH